MLFSDDEHGYWLDSGGNENGYHFMGNAQGHNSYQASYYLGKPVAVTRPSGDVEHINEDIFAFVEKRIDDGINGSEELPFSFTGGFVGYLGYELKQLR